MRVNLGKLTLVLLLLTTTLFAKTTYEWSLQKDKASLYVGEAMHLEFTCSFSDEAYNYIVEFKPKKETDLYTLKALSKREHFSNNRRIKTYSYILFPKKAGSLEVSFDARMIVTTKEAIENTVLGRDNIEYIQNKGVLHPAGALKVEVKESDSTYSGTYNLAVQSDVVEIESYKSLHVRVDLEGIGNIQNIENFDLAIKSDKTAHIFSDEVEQESELTTSGYRGKWTQKFSIVLEKDAQIEALSFRYFDLESQSVKEIKSEVIDIKVNKAPEVGKLLDVVEEEHGFEFNYVYLFIPFAFIVGLFTCKYLRIISSNQSLKESTFIQKVEAAENINTLAMLLVLEDEAKYKQLIEKIDTKDSKLSLSAIKKEVFTRNR